MSQTLTLLRYESGSQGTFGVLLHDGKWLCHSLEPACRDGKQYHAVSAGVYLLTMEWSPRFGKVLPTIIAPGRSGLRFHSGNYARETQGCVIVGNGRLLQSLSDSRAALDAIITYITTHQLNQLRVIDYESFSK